jgi:hypothetical protein
MFVGYLVNPIDAYLRKDGATVVAVQRRRVHGKSNGRLSLQSDDSPNRSRAKHFFALSPDLW